MKKKIVYFLIAAVCLSGCTADYLDKKPSKSLVVPTSMVHLQALLDGVSNSMNTAPGSQVLATDEFYHPESNLANIPFLDRNSYTWAKDIFEGNGVRDWEYPYKQIFNANIVLDGLSKISRDPSNAKDWDQLQASALFYRANALFNLAQVFAAPYDPSTASALPGIPVRLSMDVNETVGRGTLQQTYDRIIGDLIEAETKLPAQVSYISRPSQPAVTALLARIYLSMRDYDKATEMASRCLQLHTKLLDYNTLTPSAARPLPAPFSGENPEIIFYSTLQSYSTIVNSALSGVDSVLFKTYDADDLRRSCYFVARANGLFGYKGSYVNAVTLFGGLTTSEVYMIRAEGYARQNKTGLALADLNTVLAKRFKTGKLVAVNSTPENILDLVLLERRKELFARGLRWSDLRRLNKEPEHAITIKRIFASSELTLPANDSRYVFPIPDDEIRSSGIEQNPR
mgnify:FL=1